MITILPHKHPPLVVLWKAVFLGDNNKKLENSWLHSSQGHPRSVTW